MDDPTQSRPPRLAGLLCALLLALLACPARSQDRAIPSQQHFGHQGWSTEDGLPQNSVHAILQSRRGYLWIATEAGLARFDGVSFTTFRQETTPALPSDDIACLAEDAAGDLWIGASDGLVRFHAGAFTRVNLAVGPSASSVLALAAAGDGSLLALTPEGVLRVDHNAAAPLPGAPADSSAIAEAPDGSVWLASATGLLRYRNGRLEPPETSALSASPLGLQVDRTGAVWLRSAQQLHRLIISAASKPETVPGLPPAPLTASLHDRAGRLWVGTRRGLFLAATPGAPARSVAEMGDRSILSLLEDREGNLWVGTATDGLHILRPQRFAQRPELNDRIVTALAQTTDGSVWIGTRDDGLRAEHPRGNRAATEPALAASLGGEVILALAPGHHNDLWVGTLDGLVHLDGNRTDRYTSADGLPDDVVRSLLLDATETLWIGTRHGLVRWDVGSKSSRQTPPIRVDGLPGDLVGAMLQTRGTPGSAAGDLWVATLGGLTRLTANAPGTYLVRTYTAAIGLPADVITSLAEDGAGTLWLGTRHSGLSSLDATGLHTYTHSSLPATINSLVDDGRGSLWIGTPRGIVRTAFAALHACSTATAACAVPAAHFGFSDGMPTEETTASGHPAALATADGRLWFATARGVAVVDPAHLRENTVPPPVVIEHFLVDTHDELPGGFQARQPLRLPFGHGSMSFDYAGLSFTAPARVRYRYRLQGFDQQWTDAGARRAAFYTNLPPGAYTFEVQAANNDGLWNRTGAQLAFTILPPFYRRAWFYALAVLLVAALIYAAYYLRVRRLQSEFNAVLGERSRIAREIHDTLAQNFVGISLQLQIAEQLLSADNLTGAREQLGEARSLVQEGLGEARQSIWQLRASAVSESGSRNGPDSLPAQLSRAVKRAERSGLAAQINIGGIYRPIAPELEKEALRIAQEALANVVRHARATEVSVALRYETDGFRLTVVDNGRGFDPDSVRTADDHFGLQGMQERTARLAATLSVVSAPGAGTSVALTVPLPRPERRSS